MKAEGKHVANNVRDGYPAKKAGLRNGDYILEVNGKSITGIEHEAVVNLIFSDMKKVDLLVVEDIKGYKKAREKQEKIAQEFMAQEFAETPKKKPEQVIYGKILFCLIN
jgi:C-terminal processing protease CtpA/Prc